MRAMLLLLLKLPVMQLLLMPPHAVCVAATLLMRLLPLLLLKPLHLPLLHTLPTMRLHSNARWLLCNRSYHLRHRGTSTLMAVARGEPQGPALSSSSRIVWAGQGNAACAGRYLGRCAVP